MEDGDEKELDCHSLQDIKVQAPGLWKYSKTRQLTFW